jgi:hypothetical protein
MDWACRMERYGIYTKLWYENLLAKAIWKIGEVIGHYDGAW